MKQLIYPWTSFVTRIRRVIRYWKALNRLKRGLCPRCNSDPLKKDKCSLCHGYFSDFGYPPENERRLVWHNRFLTENLYAEKEQILEDPPHHH